MVQVSPDGTATTAAERGLQTREVDGVKAVLDLHKGISDPEGAKRGSGCSRSMGEYRLISSFGRVAHVRCHSPNLCLDCRTFSTLETVEMLTLDAMEYAPTIAAVLTAREHLTRRDTYRHLEQLRRALRRRWPLVEWFVAVEFQGRGALHLNLLLKGAPLSEIDAVRDVTVGLWCSRVDAEPTGQWVQPISEARGGAEGFVRYIAKVMAHGLKRSQAPPLGWRGHRTSQTRGYLVRPASVMREEARRALAFKRELWHAMREHPDDPEGADLLARARFERGQATEWVFVSAPHIATEHGWSALAAEMVRRDVDEPDGMTWVDVDAGIAERAAADAALLAAVRAQFPGAVLDR
jgi:hypothetical protein